MDCSTTAYTCQDSISDKILFNFCISRSYSIFAFLDANSSKTLNVMILLLSLPLLLSVDVKLVDF